MKPASTSRRESKLRTRIALAENREIDWTPAASRIHPRIVKAIGSSLRVEVQEAICGGKDTPILIVAAWEGDGPQFWIELGAPQLDELIELLSAARDRACAIGMPRFVSNSREVIS